MSQWYYTHEGQQKGPVPVSELHRLAATGEFDPESSLVWTDGMPDWVAASTIPELTPPTTSPGPPPVGDPPGGVPATAQSSNPYAAPSSDWNQTAPLSTGGFEGMEEIIPGSQPLDIGACISRAFELTKRHFGMILVIGIIMMAISVGASMVMGMIDGLLGWGNVSVQELTGEPELDEAIAEFGAQGSILNQIVCGFVDVFLGLGITRIGLNIVSGQPFAIGMLFSQGRRRFARSSPSCSSG